MSFHDRYSKLLKKFSLWLKDRTSFEGTPSEYSTKTIIPYFGCPQHQIIFFLSEREKGRLVLSDNTYTLKGRPFSNQVSQVIHDFNLGGVNGELKIETTESNFNRDFLKFVVALSMVTYLNRVDD